MQTKPASTSNFPPSFNYDTHVKELNERFGRLIKQLGTNNRKGSARYDFEVDFTYALREIQNCPKYLQGKMFDKASGVVSALINQLRVSREDAAVAVAS